MIGSDDGVLYVGKAKQLRQRVASYFSTRLDSIKTRCLMLHVCTIELTVTRTEHEALLLESNLIKSLKPKYNIALKDDKSYPYIRISPDLFPRLSITRNKRKDKARYFGPYVSFGSARYMMKVIQDLFPIRDCTLTIDAVHHQPKCINLDIDRCLGPCVRKNILPQYTQLVHDLSVFLSGKNKSLLTHLQHKMKEASDHLHYESASKYRDQIQFLQSLLKKGSVFWDDNLTYHIWMADSNDTFHYVLMMRVVEGRLLGQRGFYIYRNELDLSSYWIQCLLRAYSDRHLCPDHLIFPESFTPDDSVTQLLEHSIKATILYPKRGPKHDILHLAHRNVQAALQKCLTETFSIRKDTHLNTLFQLKSSLDLNQLPIRIIGFDISHLRGEGIVASAVCFVNGTPHKPDYRRYYIRSVKTSESHDPQSIYEVVKRRLASDQQTDTLPQLIVIDGGKAQLNFARRACAELGLLHQLDIVSLAKKNEELFRPLNDKPIVLPRHDSGLKLCQYIRDEAHRFALTFQRLTRQKKIQSILTTVPGLGPKRIQALYKRYGSLDNISSCNAEMIMREVRIPLHLASRLLEFCQTMRSETDDDL